jgi:hypothetical protein
VYSRSQAPLLLLRGCHLSIFGILFLSILSPYTHADFVGTGPDQNLTVTIIPSVESKSNANATGKLVIRTLLRRQGEETSFYCTRSFRITMQSHQLLLSCSKHVGTPGYEDEEMLAFEVRWSRSRIHKYFSIANISYKGDGSFFNKELYTLLGASWRQRLRRQKILPLVLTEQRTLEVFSPLSSLLDTSYVLLGRKALINIGGLSLRLPVRSIRASIMPDGRTTVLALLDTASLDPKIHVEGVSGPAVLNFYDWKDDELLNGLNIN